MGVQKILGYLGCREFFVFSPRNFSLLFGQCFKLLDLENKFGKKIAFAQYGKNTGKLFNMVNLPVKLLQIWCQVLKDCCNFVIL
jgi:hypothetical protein